MFNQEEVKMKKNLFFLTLTAAVTIPALVTSIPVHADNSAGVKIFKDIPTSHAYYKEISQMTSKGIIHGYENGMFKPDEMITRQHAATLLVRAFKPTEMLHTDLTDMSKKNANYKDMAHAVKSGWMKAPKGKARPTDTITRGEMAVALSGTAKLRDDSGRRLLTDVTTEYTYVVQTLVNAGVTTGYEDNTFRPKEGLTRAHFSTFIYRAIAYNDGIKEAHKDSVYHKMYIGKYEKGKVPVPKGITRDEQAEHFDKLKALVPKGGYAAMLSAGNVERFDAVNNRFSDVTGSTKEELAKYIDIAAKTGKVETFIGGNGKKYFVMYRTFGDSIMLGEDHRKN